MPFAYSLPGGPRIIDYFPLLLIAPLGYAIHTRNTCCGREVLRWKSQALAQDFWPPNCRNGRLAFKNLLDSADDEQRKCTVARAETVDTRHSLWKAMEKCDGYNSGPGSAHFASRVFFSFLRGIAVSFPRNVGTLPLG